MQDFTSDKDLVKVIKSRKWKSFLAKWAYPLPFVLETSAVIAASLQGIGVPILSSITSILIFSLFFTERLRDKNAKANYQFLKDLAHDVREKIDDKSWLIYSLGDVTIIPKNIQVGEDLEAINIVPIFKEGKFIVIRGDFSVEILAQYEEDGVPVVKILDKEEVKEECSKFSDKMKRKLLIGSNDDTSTSKRIG